MREDFINLGILENITPRGNDSRVKEMKTLPSIIDY